MVEDREVEESVLYVAPLCVSLCVSAIYRARAGSSDDDEEEDECPQQTAPYTPAVWPRTNTTLNTGGFLASDKCQGAV